MHLKDILDLDSYDLALDSKVEIFDMDDFADSVMHQRFSKVYYQRIKRANSHLMLSWLMIRF